MSEKRALCDTTRLLDGQIRPWGPGYQIDLVSHKVDERDRVAANSLGCCVRASGILRSIVERVWDE